MLTKYLIWSAVPLLVALVMDHAASFRVLNSSFFRIWIRTGKMLASITAWICCRLPAVIFDIVHDASLRIDSFSDDSKWSMCGRAPLFRITWVWMSSPVTILPTARKAALTILCESCLVAIEKNAWVGNFALTKSAKVTYIRSSTRRRQTPASITAWILSFGPSDK